MFLCKDQLTGRIDRYGRKLLNRPLALHIKAADGFHIISPQLDPVRVFLCQIENINDPATNAELPRCFHLIDILIAKLHELLCHLFFIQRAITAYRDHIIPENRKWNLRCKKTPEGRHHSKGSSLHHPAETPDPLLGKLISMDICLIKDHIPGWKAGRISVIKAVVLLQLLHPLVAEGHDQPAPESFRKAIYHMKLLGLHTACQSCIFPRLF